jgi:hypothetical protein
MMVKRETLLFLLLVIASTPDLPGTTTQLKRGPKCRVEKEVDRHLFQVHVTPPAATADYAPGHLRIFLRREYPDYIYVPLEYERLKDGRLHVQIAISPEMEQKYTINVLDQQKDQLLLLFSEKLREIPLSKKP